MTKLEKKTETELFKQLVDECNCDDRKIWVSLTSLIKELKEIFTEALKRKVAFLKLRDKIKEEEDLLIKQILEENKK